MFFISLEFSRRANRAQGPTRNRLLLLGSWGAVCSHRVKPVTGSGLGTVSRLARTRKPLSREAGTVKTFKSPAALAPFKSPAPQSAEAER